MSDRSLLPPNATRYERALADTAARVSDVATPLRDLWNPDTCPAELLPWLAWSLGVAAWKPYWSEAIKRQRIKQAVEIHRRRGTVQSVRRVVESFGAGVAIREWWQSEPRGIPHTFELILTVRDSNNAAELQQDIIQEVNRVKPVRSHFTLIAGVAAEGGIGIYGAARPAIYRRIQTEE
ncbi:phage tail protein I [Billgrantia desiderata]|uniref:phage tail protein I n=1 Tax=Billgrantia desiderata TaxID=52021 RepID=UPI00089F5AD1|nr:phage tail protein I [Halomonas desiderata]SEG44098.1 phage tail protein, P2 protein I family [Halomonas desiderata]